MILEPFAPFVASAFQIKFATRPWEKRGAHALRRAVFCEEQGIFEGDDLDAIDETAIPIVAISLFGVAADAVVGTVRIHERQAGLWVGSRLAVAVNYRRVGMLGGSLIKLAVSSAHARGCVRFLADVQSQNVLLFRRMHWRTVEEVVLHGRPHHRMEADLSFYPPFVDAETGFHSLARKAA
ncbi:MSMEG_0567/Sll0786 family nitrogen starvation N-acetyltransferase [Methylocella tundrae]|uniref:Histone acetyltransferase n=1 Tax=Methylocella tundrae TaxID=227605 RepID=A0A4V6IN19_METTU|nr:MSMEG_0567/Sll0786 family nitrogen starvation N-acetyltransferase [Methylocella tundrae]WPP04291.1 MSMEG_0567/Sll0786 family nitrogen starvation N-acetyltransferase [Methylocella tundrae]VFU10618.1 Histone acetyltransferase [Methylocella tundrae]